MLAGNILLLVAGNVMESSSIVLLTMLCFLGVVTYVPELSLWLPRALGMLY
jgi:TRAP-type C4-dicarboxylate transport system permease large subunit